MRVLEFSEDGAEEIEYDSVETLVADWAIE